MSRWPVETLFALASRLGDALDAESIARVVVTGVVQAVHASRCVAYEIEGEDLRLIAQYGLDPDQEQRLLRIPRTTNLPLGRALETAEPVYFETYEQLVASYPSMRVSTTPASALRAVAALPLSIRGRVVGGLAFSFEEERTFSADERSYFVAVAELCAQAVDRARLFQSERRARADAERAAERTRALELIARRLSAALRAEDIAESVLPDAAAALQADTSSLWIPDDTTHTMRNIGRATMPMQTSLDGDAPVAVAYRSDTPIWLDDLACLPVKLGDRVLGTLAFGFEWRRALAESDRSFMLVLARHCAQALERARLFEEQERARLRAERLQAITLALGGARTQQDVRDILVRAGAAALGAHDAVIAEGPREGPYVWVDIPGEATRLGFARLRAFDAHETTFIAELANVASLAIARARSFASEAEARRATEEALARAREADRRKDEFLAMLGHELRNPLAPIATAVQLMKLHGVGMDARARDVIDRQVQHMSRLLDDLMDVSRITRGRVELRRQIVDLAEPVAKAIEQTSAMLEQKTQRLVLEAAPAALPVLGDPVRLAQVVANLLTNASKYSRAGSTVVVRTRREGARITLEVVDEGIGIATELLPHVFDSFVQAPQAIARSRGGLGLGLAIVKTLVEMHGGSVEAHSGGEGHGSRFVLFLPVHETTSEDEPATPRALELAPLPPRDARVLVVDDNTDAAELVVEALSSAGYEARAAFDGPSALAEAERFHPHVAVLDIGLPVMDGYELAQRLRENENGPHTLIALTGYGQPSDRQRALAAGFDQHFVKPLALETLLRYLRRRDAQR